MYATHPQRASTQEIPQQNTSGPYNQAVPGPISHPSSYRPPPPPVDILTGTDDTALPLGDEAPQKPPNPQRVQAVEYLQKCIDEVVDREIRPEVTKDHEALNQTAAALDWMEKTMARERVELDRLAASARENAKSLDERMDSAKQAISAARTRPPPELDDAISAETVVHNQLYQLVADDHAIDDALYVLGKALDSDRIKLDQYMKHTRLLGREQFMKRALVLKISKQLNLV